LNERAHDWGSDQRNEALAQHPGMVIGGADGVAVQSQAGSSLLIRLNATALAAAASAVALSIPSFANRAGPLSFEFSEFLNVSSGHCIFIRVSLIARLRQ